MSALAVLALAERSTKQDRNARPAPIAAHHVQIPGTTLSNRNRRQQWHTKNTTPLTTLAQRQKREFAIASSPVLNLSVAQALKSKLAMGLTEPSPRSIKAPTLANMAPTTKARGIYLAKLAAQLTLVARFEVCDDRRHRRQDRCP
jgi:hypothetical protein